MKTATSAMKYEKTAVTPLIKRKFAASLTKDINKLSSYRIVMFLYKRHSVGVWQAVALLVLTVAIIK